MNNGARENIPEKISIIPTKPSSLSITDNAQTPFGAADTLIPVATNTQPADQETDIFSVVARPNASNSSQTDVFLQNLTTQTETLFITLDDVYREHYHVGEFHQGNLYIIRRMGYPDEQWTDALWRYNPQKQGERIFSARGLDFRVSADERWILIFSPEEFNILNQRGEIRKSFKNSEVNVNPQYDLAVNFLAWGSNSIWLTNSADLTINGIVKIDVLTYAITKYDVSGLGMSMGSEFAFNINKELIAFSDYPYFMTPVQAQEYAQSGKTVHLIVLDLNSNTQRQIATSITTKFAPKWIDENTLEYDAPDGAGRITITIT